MNQPTASPRGPREWRLSADDDQLPTGPLAARALPLLVLALFVTACAVPLAASFYLLAWPAINEPNSAVPGMVGPLALLVAGIGAIVVVLRVAAVLRRG